MSSAPYAMRSRLHQLLRESLIINFEAAAREVGLWPNRDRLVRNLYRHAVACGATLLVAGVIYFVAANWAAMSATARLTWVGLPVVGATMAAGYLGNGPVAGILGWTGGTMFGAWLAVFGQTYQTGADAWTLFAPWSVVLFGYALCWRFAALILSGLVIGHVAVFAYLSQVCGGDLYEGTNALVLAALGVIDAMVVVLAERYLRDRTQSLVAAGAATIGLSVVMPHALRIILDGVGSGHRIAGGIVVVIGLIAIGGYYNTRRPRLSMLIALATCSTVLATTLLGRLLVVDSLFQLIFLGVLVCAIVGAWGHWLRRWRSRVLSNRGSDAAPRSMSRPEHDPIATLVERLHPVSTRTDEVAARFARADDADHDEVPIGVRLYSAVGMWVGGMLVALVLVLLGLLDNAALALLAGGTCLAAAIGLARNPPLGLVRSQLVWIVGVGAHLALASAALESGLDEVELLASATLLNATAASTIRLPSFRFGSVVATVWFAASAAHAMQLPFGVVGATLPAMALGVWVWLDEALWARRLRYAWPPLAFGLPFGAAAPILFVSLPQNRTTMASPTTLATTLFSLVLVAWVMWRTYRKDPPLQIGRGAIVAGVATLGFLLSAYTVPGLTMALVWLILAELRGSTALRGIAIIQLGLCLFLFYYNLDLSFLAKSVAVSGPGALLLLAARHGGPLRSLARSQPRWRPAIALVVVTVGLVGGSVAAKEHTLARGRTVLLPLAPVDPRSLMQGDYMDLRYDLPRLESPHSRRGLLVLTVDDDQVGRFTRFDNGDTLAGNEIRMRYRRLDAGELRLGAESFFFEEGTGHIYESARYGEVVLDEKGHSVLVGLRGRDRAPLGHSLHRTR